MLSYLTRLSVYIGLNPFYEIVDLSNGIVLMFLPNSTSLRHFIVYGTVCLYVGGSLLQWWVLRTLPDRQQCLLPVRMRML